jgi:prefoldin beta subunit
MSENEKIQEMQIIEQNLQNILYQKQNFQIEASETKAALKEIEKSGDEVFKVIGNLMIKSEKDKIKNELSDKEKVLDMRLQSLEKQEKSLVERLEELRKEFVNSKENSAK